jgi:hypothetical protein
MRKLLLATCLTILVLADIASQNTHENLITGSWYLSNPNLLETKDTLLFSKELIGNTFNLWDFKANKTLIISTGTLRGNIIEPKCFSEVLYYKWMFIDTTNYSVILEISMGEKVDLYSLIFLGTEHMKLQRINSDN